MVSIQGGSSGGGGFDYVQDPSPQAPEEGEEWYDTGSDRAFVFDGSAWIEQTIGDHGQLSGVGASDHHSRPTGTNSATGSVFTNTSRQKWGLSGTIGNVADGGDTESSTTTGDTAFTRKYRVHMDEPSETNIHYVDLRDESGTWHTIRTSGGTWDETVDYYVTGIRAKATNNHSSWHRDFGYWVRPYLMRPAGHSHSI